MNTQKFVNAWKNGNKKDVYKMYDNLSISGKEKFLDILANGYINNFTNDDRIQMLKYLLIKQI